MSLRVAHNANSCALHNYAHSVKDPRYKQGGREGTKLTAERIYASVGTSPEDTLKTTSTAHNDD